MKTALHRLCATSTSSDLANRVIVTRVLRGKLGEYTTHGVGLLLI
jgi:hypothetical protein